MQCLLKNLGQLASRDVSFIYLLLPARQSGRRRENAQNVMNSWAGLLFNSIKPETCWCHEIWTQVSTDISALTGPIDPLILGLVIDEFGMWTVEQPVSWRPLRAVYSWEIYGAWWVFSFVCSLHQIPLPVKRSVWAGIQPLAPEFAPMPKQIERCWCSLDVIKLLTYTILYPKLTKTNRKYGVKRRPRHTTNEHTQKRLCKQGAGGSLSAGNSQICGVLSTACEHPPFIMLEPSGASSHLTSEEAGGPHHVAVPPPGTRRRPEYLTFTC